MNIITLTLNPAIDVHVRAESLVPSSYNTVEFCRRDSAGKGVNVSRAIAAWGGKSLCYAVLGEDNAEAFAAPLFASGIALKYITVPGRVRENVNVQHSSEETVIAMSGVPLGREVIERVISDLSPFITNDTVLCFSGSLADGTDKEAVLSMLYEFKRLGARLVIDSRSLSTEEIISLRPYLIKPNEHEATALTGMVVDTPKSAVGAAMALRDMGCENVLLTLGAEGAALACPSGVFMANAPKISPISTVGAGDSTVAGFLMSDKLGADSLRLAVAFGSAACLTAGSSAPDPCQVKKLIKEITITECADGM